MDLKEEIIWETKPSKKIYLKTVDLFLFPWGFLWLSMATLWLSTAIKFLSQKGGNKFELPFIILGFVFFLGGIYFFLGRFIYLKQIRKTEKYVLTNRRLIIKRKKVLFQFGTAKESSLGRKKTSIRNLVQS